jgi:hypothetical protein
LTLARITCNKDCWRNELAFKLPFVLEETVSLINRFGLQDEFLNLPYNVINHFLRVPIYVCLKYFKTFYITKISVDSQPLLKEIANTFLIMYVVRNNLGTCLYTEK